MQHKQDSRRQPAADQVVVLDHELLVTCAASDDLETWRRKLGRAGLLHVPPTDGPPPPGEGSAVSSLRRVRRLFTELEDSERGLPATRAGGEPGLSQAMRHPAVPVAAVALLIVGWATMGAFGLIVAVMAMLGGLMWMVRPTDAPHEPQTVAPLSRTLHREVRELLANTFVEVQDGVVFENSPHRTFLLQRVADVERARAGLERRVQELIALRAGLVQTNTQLGRQPEDEEVQAIDKEHQRIVEQLERLNELQSQLQERLGGFDEAFEHMRLLARRRALSAQVGSMLDEPPSARAQRAAAAIEVDVLGLEARFDALQLELSDADAKLRAVLEIEATTRQS